jgi:pimeloyl-ACP methyl ester carboxylesterase
VTPIAAGRRAVMLGGALVAGLAAARQAAAAPPPAEEAIWRHEYWARKGDVSLYLYRKRRTAPDANAPKLPVLFLVHGSSISSRPSFDLTVPGAGEYSLMNVFARYGFDVWTMDFEGYGRSGVTSGNSDIASGVADLRAATALVATETGLKKFHFMGESSGAIRAGAFAMAEPDRVDRLVLEAFTYTGRGSPTLGKRAEQTAFYRTHNRRPRDRAMIESIFTRDKPGTSEMIVADAVAAEELKLGNTMPTGTYLDMCAHLPLVDPEKMACPVQIIRGEHDGIATIHDILAFFEKVANPDKQFTVLPGSAHIAQFGLNFRRFYHVLFGFLQMPTRVDVNI